MEPDNCVGGGGGRTHIENWPVGLTEFNWVELFTLRWLMDEIRVLPRRFPKAGKTKPNMPDSTSRLVESLVAHPSWDNHLSSKARKVFYRKLVDRKRVFENPSNHSVEWLTSRIPRLRSSLLRLLHLIFPRSDKKTPFFYLPRKCNDEGSQNLVSLNIITGVINFLDFKT